MEKKRLTMLCSPDGIGDPKNAREETSQLHKDILVDVQRQQELQRLDLRSTPAAHLHHKT